MVASWIVRRIAGPLVVISCSVTVAYAQGGRVNVPPGEQGHWQLPEAYAQDPDGYANDAKVYSPTELVETSDEIRAGWHRILGKVEGAVPDKAQAEAIQEKLFTWLDDSANTAPRTFDEAQQELSNKLKAVDASFDAARAAGTLESWDPKQPGSQQPPPEGAPAPAPVVASSAPSSAPVADAVPASNALAGAAAQPNRKAAEAVAFVVMLLGGALGFNVYPRIFQPQSDNYFKSWFQRLQKRIGVTVVFMFCSYFLGFIVGSALFGK